MGVLIIGLSVASSVLGLIITHRFFPHSVRHVNNEVAGFFIAVLGVVYAVLLAFVVIVVWEDFTSARSASEVEAADLISLYRLSRAFPEPAATNIRTGVSRYVHTVIDDEWPKLAHGEVSPNAGAAMDDLWTIVSTFEPRTTREEAVYAEGLQRLDDVSDHRQLRVFESRNVLPPLMWVLLIGGGIITVAFTYFLAAPSIRAQLIMTGLYTALIAFALFLIVAIDQPFAGDLGVTPEAFGYALGTFVAAR
jgi:hypothetical protein